MKIDVRERILVAHEKLTAENRRLLAAHGILTINLMGSPGAGKTSLLERVLPLLGDGCRSCVVEGDLFTSLDAERIAAAGIAAVQINTRGACHLDGAMIKDALAELPLVETDLLVIENIGNLVCPAEFDLGEDLRICLLSTPEGEDKVAKYPLMFKEAAAVILTKTDLLPYVGFSLQRFYQDLHKLNPQAAIFELSCKTGDGLPALAAWLAGKLAAKKTQVAGA